MQKNACYKKVAMTTNFMNKGISYQFFADDF